MVRLRQNKRRKNADQLETRKWEDLDRDVLEYIFSLMKWKYLIFVVSRVCKSWRSACWDVLFWDVDDTLDLEALCGCRERIDEDYNETAMKLMRVFKSITSEVEKFSCVTTIIFHKKIALSDKHLVYLAERSPRLKRLYLECASRITGKGFSRAVRKWKGLEELSIKPMETSYYVHMLKEIGINCKKLQVLCLSHFDLNLYLAPVISESIKGLKELRLNHFCISELGLQVMFAKCKKLEKLYIRRSANMELVAINSYEPLEIRKEIVGSAIKWFIDTKEFSSLKIILDVLWKRCELAA